MSPTTLDLVREAAAKGAGFVLTPEVTNIVSTSRAHQKAVLHSEGSDPTLAALRAEARALGIWLLIGSLALKTRDADGRFANRSFMINPKGEITARYDKIHMFDVEISATESYRESAGYRPGTRAVLSDTDFGPVGRARPIGKACCVPVPLKPGVSCLPPRNVASTGRPARPMAVAWRCRPGARFWPMVATCPGSHWLISTSRMWINLAGACHP